MYIEIFHRTCATWGSQEKPVVSGALVSTEGKSKFVWLRYVICNFPFSMETVLEQQGKVQNSSCSFVPQEGIFQCLGDIL